MARYECDANFQLLGEDSRVCQANGTWTGQPPSCFLTCPTLIDPQNGTLEPYETNVGSEACYSCDEGFRVQGCTSTFRNCTVCRTCDTNGEWSGIEPECEGMETLKLHKIVTVCVFFHSPVVATLGPTDCGGLDNPDNGIVDLSEGTMTGARANYSCDEGFELDRAPTRTCGQDGKWTGTAPKCSCKDPFTTSFTSHAQSNLKFQQLLLIG